MSGNRNTIDINATLQGQVSVVPDEHPDVLAQRLKDFERKSKNAALKEIATFWVMLFAIVLIGIGAGYEGYFDHSADADTKKGAQTLLWALATGALGFVTGHKIGSKD